MTAPKCHLSRICERGYSLSMPSRTSTDLMTFEEYCQTAGISPRTLLRWLSYDELRGAHKENGRWRIPSGAVRSPQISEGGERRRERPTVPEWTLSDRLRKARESAGL